MKRLILSRLWMLISIIILTTGQAWAKTPPTSQKVFNSIKDLRDAAAGNTLSDVVIQFNESTNPAIVVAVMTKHDPDITDDEKFINSFFVVDNCIQILAIRSCCRISIFRICICNCIHIFDFSNRICSTCLDYIEFSRIIRSINILRFMYRSKIWYSACTLTIVT